MNIQGKTVLVTGASRGIGREIALEFARQGARRLLLVARSQSRLVEVAAEIEAFGVEAIPIALNLIDCVEVNITIAQIWRDYAPIQILINCAGVAYQTPFLLSQPSQMQEEVGLNLMGMYNITRLIARRMAVQRQGTIVNVSSLMGKIAAPTMATYSATKFAILGFTQALRGELAPHNIRVIALLPSLTNTEMVQNFQWFRWVMPTTPQKVAQTLIAGLERESPEILVGWQSHLAVWANRLMPWFVEKIAQMASPLSKSHRDLDARLRAARAGSR
ncbi:MAG TPA: SDR family NAD(P)-dependent oxidoreductase [Leptolyngbya sp.]|jgi:3-oxoacyl-[acyl-carrier protein] reductase|nr:SDR family NAD(P)-dependent oxidoreductase [Leptolyngbya sp.]